MAAARDKRVPGRRELWPPGAELPLAEFVLQEAVVDHMRDLQFGLAGRRQVNGLRQRRAGAMAVVNGDQDSLIHGEAPLGP